MSTRYVIDKERRLVVCTLWDRLTFAEVTALQDQLLSNPDFNREFNLLADTTAITQLEVSPAEAKVIARRHIFSHPSRCAFLAKSAHIFGMTRLAQAYSETGKERAQWQVFYDRDEALKWLGLETLP